MVCNELANSIAMTPSQPSMFSTWSLRAQAACLALGGGWLLVRALLFGSYTLGEYAVQAGAISLLASLVILARLRPRGEKDSRQAELPSSYSVLDGTRLVLAVILLIAVCVCQIWWVVRIAHGFYLKRLQFGLEPFTKIILGLWSASILVCPRPMQTEPSRQRERLRTAINVLGIVLLVWTYPYTDPFTRYVQWSGLYLMVVAMLAIWNLLAWLRGELFVAGWLNFLAKLFVPDDLWVQDGQPAADSQRSRTLLGAICLGAMAMQAVNISWGLPPNIPDREFRQIHPDEKVTFEQAWRLYIDPEPVTFVRGGTAYYRLGMFAKDIASYFSDPEFTQRLQILLLRWMNVVAVGGSVLLAFFSGSVLFDRRTALLAALLMAILPGNVVMSHPARPDAIFTFLCVIGLHVSIRAASSPAAVQWLLWGGLVLGISTATKVTGVGLMAPLAVAMLMRRPSICEVVARTAMIILMAVIGYALASFETFFFFHRFLEGMAFTRTLQGARSWTDFFQSIAAYLGPISGYAWTIPGTILLWTSVVVAIRRRECLVVIAMLVVGHLISFGQRDVTLRSHVHLSIAVSLLIAHILALGLDACRSKPWIRRAVLVAESLVIMLIAQESLGHVAYLRFGEDARDKARIWIETHISPDRSVALTPYFHGDWGSSPALDEFSRRVVLLPVSRIYDASDYIDREIDFVVLCDLTLEAAQKSPEAEAFLKHVRSQRNHTLIQTFVPSFEAIHPAEWLGWTMHLDWRYTRPTFYLYERNLNSAAAQETP